MPMKIARVMAVFALALLAALATGPRVARAVSCKPDRAPCGTNPECCGKACLNSAPPGSRPFTTCCTPTTCAKQGANCGTIPNGTCPRILNCGSCTSPNSCGGGGTPNLCGCTPITTCPAGNNCGSVPDGCGGTLSCGTCTAPNTCGGGGTPNACGCTPRTCADVGASTGTILDGCGGTLDCGAPCTTDADCIDTQFCYFFFEGHCVPKLGDDRPCFVENNCLSGCCCDAALCTFNTATFVFPTPGVCTQPSDCSVSARTRCPGATAPSQDWNTCCHTSAGCG